MPGWFDEWRSVVTARDGEDDVAVGDRRRHVQGHAVRRSADLGNVRVLAIALGALAVAATPTAVPAPKGWRYPTSTEVSQPWRSESAHHYSAFSADFDGDGMNDRAMLLLRTGTPEAALVVVLGRTPTKPIVLERLEDPSWLDVMGIELVVPGRYKTACGKGYFECEPGEGEFALLKHPGIDFFKSESANSFFYFDSRTAGFRRVWISD